MKERILIAGDDEVGTEGSDPTIILEEASGIRDITDTTLGDKHASRPALIREIAAKSEDWGDGFYVEPVPVLIERSPDGAIVRTTPLGEIPGVHLERGGLVPDDPKEVAPVVTPVPLATADREKLVGILSLRLYNYYRGRGPNDPKYNPFRDGVPVLPSGSPEHLQPLPGTKMFPATDGQIMDYLKDIVVSRATVINKNRFGGNTIQDIALRIE